jgi:hypothetical protein
METPQKMDAELQDGIIAMLLCIRILFFFFVATTTNFRYRIITRHSCHYTGYSGLKTEVEGLFSICPCGGWLLITNREPVGPRFIEGQFRLNYALCRKTRAKMWSH